MTEPENEEISPFGYAMLLLGVLLALAAMEHG
jgi:hypothetical protein